MAGLSDYLTNTSTETTALPSWYSAAQIDAVNKATAGANAMPSIGNTVAGQAISNLSNPATNPFNQGQGTLNTIATGAANPWLKDASGNVTPNTDTALGGLFSAQNQQLKTLLPQYEAPATAGTITSGNFGSLRGQTAADTAVTNAQANLFSDQMKAALQNEQTGVNAATGLGNIGEQATATESKLGQMQQADPMASSAALASLLKSITAPQTITKSDATSPLTQFGQLKNIYKDLPTTVTDPINSAVGGILGAIFGDTSGIINNITGEDNSYSPGTDVFNQIWGS